MLFRTAFGRSTSGLAPIPWVLRLNSPLVFGQSIKLYLTTLSNLPLFVKCHLECQLQGSKHVLHSAVGPSGNPTDLKVVEVRSKDWPRPQPFRQRVHVWKGEGMFWWAQMHVRLIWATRSGGVEVCAGAGGSALSSSVYGVSIDREVAVKI